MENNWREIQGSRLALTEILDLVGQKNVFIEFTVHSHRAIMAIKDKRGKTKFKFIGSKPISESLYEASNTKDYLTNMAMILKSCVTVEYETEGGTRVCYFQRGATTGKTFEIDITIV